MTTGAPRSNARLASAIVIAALVIGAGIVASSYLGTSTTETRTSTSTATTTETLASTTTTTSTLTTVELSTTTATSTSTTVQLSTTTSVQTQTVVSQTSYTVTTTFTNTETSTTTETVGSTTYLLFTGLDYLSNLPGCAVSSGVISYPAPCFGPNSNAVAFNCAAAAATSQGCTQEVYLTGSPTQNFTITVLYPNLSQVGEYSWQNCRWTEPLPAPIGPQSGFAYCISTNSTSFFVAIPAPPVV